MDLAFATGHGPELLTNLEGLRPLVRDEDVVAFGFRDARSSASTAASRCRRSVLALDLQEVRRLGVEEAAQRAVEHLTWRPARADSSFTWTRTSSATT